MNILKKTYDWVLSWSESRWGALALFLLAFAESSFFPIPPDVLLIALCLGCAAKAFRYALICTTGSLLGAVAGYAIGYFLWQTPSGEFTAVADFFFRVIPGFTIEEYEKISHLYNEYNFWVVFTAGFSPIPYKLITITAGVFRLDVPIFLLASIISRGLRFALIAWMIWKFGAPIKTFIDKYFNWLALAFTVLLVGGFIAIKYAV
ncbi:YqaA family protein [uncultured Alistipes sp.]|uniref:YqaA family protein n=1 Tax=uncultured Alistipes sp. TaxID=538949 RepID=UPI00262625B1|nr:YqaA family protein [uncultured Alistipes sp.]